MGCPGRRPLRRSPIADVRGIGLCRRRPRHPGIMRSVRMPG
jgi:hypothetical protein